MKRPIEISPLGRVYLLLISLAEEIEDESATDSPAAKQAESAADEHQITEVNQRLESTPAPGDSQEGE